jgi:hypothetical protein
MTAAVFIAGVKALRWSGGAPRLPTFPTCKFSQVELPSLGFARGNKSGLSVNSASTPKLYK